MPQCYVMRALPILFLVQQYDPNVCTVRRSNILFSLDSTDGGSAHFNTPTFEGQQKMRMHIYGIDLNSQYQYFCNL